MKRFLVFAMHQYDVAGGWDDYQDGHDTLDQAQRHVARLLIEQVDPKWPGARFHWAQLVDLEYPDSYSAWTVGDDGTLRHRRETR